MDPTFVTKRQAQFRPSPAPTVPLPFGLRSLGCYQFLEPTVVDQLRPRPFVQVYWCSSGRIEFTDQDTAIEVKAGEIFAYRSLIQHRIRTMTERTRYWWFTIDGPLADACLEEFGLRPPWPKSAGPPPERLFQRLSSIIGEPSQASERSAASLGWELLSAASSGDLHPDENESVGRLRRQLIERSADADLSVSRLATELGEDRSVLTRRFARQMGVAPKPFLQQLRLSRAMSLLHATNVPVSSIARDCGFADPGYFSRVFREHTGMTPEQFRKG